MLAACQAWREGDADKAANMLLTCVCLTEETISDHFATLLPAMCKVSAHFHSCQLDLRDHAQLWRWLVHTQAVNIVRVTTGGKPQPPRWKSLCER